jgi:hypothetical protein
MMKKLLERKDNGTKQNWQILFLEEIDKKYICKKIKLEKGLTWLNGGTVLLFVVMLTREPGQVHPNYHAIFGMPF